MTRGSIEVYRPKGVPVKAGFLKVIKGRGEAEAVAFVAAWLWLQAKSQQHWWAPFEVRGTLASISAATGLSRPCLSRALRRGAKTALWSYTSGSRGVVIASDGGGLRRRYLAVMKEGREGVVVPTARQAHFLLHHRIDHIPAGWLRQRVARIAHWLRTTRQTLRSRVLASHRIFTRGVAKSTTADTHPSNGRSYTIDHRLLGGGRKRNSAWKKRRGRSPPPVDRIWQGVDPETGEPWKALPSKVHVDVDSEPPRKERDSGEQRQLGFVPSPVAPNANDGFDRQDAPVHDPATIPVARLFRHRTGTGMSSLSDLLRAPADALEVNAAAQRRAIQLAPSPMAQLDAIDWMTKARPARTRLLRKLAVALGSVPNAAQWIRQTVTACCEDTRRPAAASFHYRIVEKIRGADLAGIVGGSEAGALHMAPRARSAQPTPLPPPAPAPGLPEPAPWAGLPAPYADTIAAAWGRAPIGIVRAVCDKVRALSDGELDPTGWRRRAECRRLSL